jgi:hypothetical protein
MLTRLTRDFLYCGPWSRKAMKKKKREITGKTGRHNRAERVSSVSPRFTPSMVPWPPVWLSLGQEPAIGFPPAEQTTSSGVSAAGTAAESGSPPTETPLSPVHLPTPAPGTAEQPSIPVATMAPNAPQTSPSTSRQPMAGATLAGGATSETAPASSISPGHHAGEPLSSRLPDNVAGGVEAASCQPTCRKSPPAAEDAATDDVSVGNDLTWD